MKITEFTFFLDMEEEKKKQFVELVYKNYHSDVYKFLQSNKDYIKGKLSGSQRKMFEDDVLKRKTLSVNFLNKLLETLDEDKFKSFANRILKVTYKDDKELAEEVTSGNEVDEEKLIKYFAIADKDNKEHIKILFDCLGIDVNFSEEVVNKVANNIAIENLQKDLEKKEEEIKQLKKEAEEAEKNHKKEIKELKEVNATKIKKKDEDIKELKEENQLLKNKKDAVKIVEVEKVVEVPSSVKKDSFEEETKKAESSKQVLNEKGIPVDLETALDDLEARTLIGVVKGDGIKPDKSWVIVQPIVPIISENSNIDREDFFDNVDCRSDYSSFLLFLSEEVLKMVLSEEDADDYPYMTSDQKFSCLFNAFCKKLIFFTPHFVGKEGEKYKLNAYLLEKPVDYKDFNNSTFVPCYSSSKKDFESKINRHCDLILENYPYSLSSNLRYIFVKDSIYEINYIPGGYSIDDRPILWKYNEQSSKEPFRKLDLKVESDSSDKYIYVPNPFDDKPDLYVKNIMFIQTSTKKEAIFNEDEFINNVSENAKSRNLYYKENDLKNFHIAVKSSNLVILAGPSGIGKTRLPMVYANTLGLDIARNTVLFVPISPSYLEPEDVLGYVRPISEDGNEFNAEYMESQTGLVSFLIDAAEHKDKIHLVIFDEMNLSQIEHWFAPFISLLEQDPDSRELKLYSDNLVIKNSNKYPSSINIGENVFFVGTVNIDETTKQISDRLLDRAVVINLAAPSFTSLKDMGSAKVEIYPEITFSRFATAMKKVGNSATEFSEKEFALINDLNTLLTDSIYNKSISFRSLNKMALYLKNSSGILSRNEAIDFVVSQIVVKKINGSKEELDEIFSDDDTQGILKILNNHPDVSEFVNTRKVVQQKILEIKEYGFTR